jgi:threonylcarbamoyladenosine tRNA methylthiotransferase MtaB
MKVFLDSVGCRLNQSEIESYARQFRAAGHVIVGSPDQADLVVINTCSVTEPAAADSRQKVRQAARAGAGQIVLTGCWSTLEPDNAARLPGVSRIVPNQVKDDLVLNVLQAPPEIFEREFIEREPLPGAHMRTRAFIKVQDGCDNHCTFCVTTIARGVGRSRSVEGVLLDIQAAVRGGTREVVLSGVHLGSWGYDFSPKQHLRHLVQAVLADSDVTRLRLSSLEPWDLDESFFKLWQDPRMCRHLHLPLQSGSAATLRRMARKTTPASFRALVESARLAVPEIAITTDIIVGFPGETESEFAESLAFIEAMQFAGGHVFTYSARPGTAAARMPQHVRNIVRKDRSVEVRRVLDQAATNYHSCFLGHEVEVLWEGAAVLGPSGWRMNGLTDNYLRVEALAPQHLWNQVSRVRLESLVPHGLSGTIQAIKEGNCG